MVGFYTAWIMHIDCNSTFTEISIWFHSFLALGIGPEGVGPKQNGSWGCFLAGRHIGEQDNN